jgi:hypothetical protein
VTVLSSVDPPNLTYIDGAYYVSVGTNVFGSDAAASLRTLLAASAESEVYGPTRQAVVGAATEGFAVERPEVEPGLFFGHSGQWLRDHEYDYFTFLTQIAQPPESE